MAAARLRDGEALLRLLEDLPVSARELDRLWERLTLATQYPQAFPRRGTAQRHYIAGHWGLYYTHDSTANEIVPVAVVNNYRNSMREYRVID